MLSKLCNTLPDSPNDDFKSLNSLKAYFEEIWNHKDSKIYKKRNSKNNDELIQHYEQLKTKLPEAFEKIDYYNLTVETNHISLINNPINTSNKTPEMWDTVNYIMCNLDHATTKYGRTIIRGTACQSAYSDAIARYDAVLAAALRGDTDTE